MNIQNIRRIFLVMLVCSAVSIAPIISMELAIQKKRGKKKESELPMGCMRVTDDRMIVTIQIPKHLGPQKRPAPQPVLTNPFIQKREFSWHVNQKFHDKTDKFHNFSPEVDFALGFFVSSEIIKEPTAKHSAEVRYSIPATVQMLGGNKYSGEFEIVVRDQKIVHRMFKPF